MFERIRFHLFKWFRPHFVGRYRRADGRLLPLTRVGNTTYITGRENLDIGDNVFIGHYSFIDATNGLHIGEGCQIGYYVTIATHSSHIAIRLYGREYTRVSKKIAYGEGSVFVGRYTFVGPHSIIMPGSRIGKGSLVSAYSYVKGNFPDFAILAGNPAVVVGDTRTLDAPYLEQHPELRPFYAAWAKDDQP
jgi:acetyltransferase-like isoleucine patch superfamily enzyme